MIDVVIPYKPVDTPELHYCIEGIKKYLSNVGRIFVVSDTPVPGAEHIYCEDSPRSKHKERNIHRKILAACNDSRVSETFLRMHDDHFLLSHIDAENFPFHHKGAIKHHKAGLSTNPYRHTINNTINALSKRKLPSYHFDTHCPMLFSKTQYVDVMKQYDWDNMPYGYLLKSLYANTLRIDGLFYPDCKTLNPSDIPPGRLYFSTGGWSAEIELFLQNKYNSPL